MQKRAITVAYGDGIGPEIMEACLYILEQAGAQIEPEFIEIGEQVYLSGNTSGITADAWESLRRTKVFYKAPITTPQGGGYKSLNVTMRKTLGLYANVRPCRAYHPFVVTKHPDMDVVVVRENEEDLYAGIEHQQTDEVVQCLKLVSRPGTEKIIRYAFEYARANGRKKVTCFTKDNIMKLTDGMFHKVFKEIAVEYPELETEHWIIDIGTALLADQPEKFDVIVVPNLYGDIVSDVAAQIAGSVGMAGSANIGAHVSMFEAIHGSAPTIAGQNIANPSGLLMAGVMMLNHLGQPEIAEKVHNAWLRTIEDGVHTADITKDSETVGTRQFAEEVVARLGQLPQELEPVHYTKMTVKMPEPQGHEVAEKKVNKQLVGVDVFLDYDNRDPNHLGQLLVETANGDGLELVMITNRGQKVYPNGAPETFCTDHWRCRFATPDEQPIEHAKILRLLERISSHGMDFIKTENLYTFDGERGFSLGQGQ